MVNEEEAKTVQFRRCCECLYWLNEKLLICAVNTPQPSVTELRKARGNLPLAYHECPDFRERFDQDQYSLPPGARALLRD